jgi:hypothetical protein
MKYSLSFLLMFSVILTSLSGQMYFLERYAPYEAKISSPSQFLGHEIGTYHTRHDQMTAYFSVLDAQSDNAIFMRYGKSHEGRDLTMLVISSKENLAKLDAIRQAHRTSVENPDKAVDPTLPLIINLGYNVHGNEPSTAEAALLTAYTLLASKDAHIKNLLDKAVIFIDPVINPDGRERHSQWANMYKANALSSDSEDAEHNEAWPRGRGNHYWFDLNRDWLLAIHPESRSKLQWYHQWYPHVIGDFHEMGTNSSFFFEPMKTNGSKNPIMPKENYTRLNDLFGQYFASAMDSLGSLYFTKEVFDGTYPGYGSSYGDIQGGLALLFEQASSRGHVQETHYGDMTFAFTIRNQFVATMATLKAATDNSDELQSYQKYFFKSALENADKDIVKAYSFPNGSDAAATAAFIDKLLLHKVKAFKNKDNSGFIVPTKQSQYRMVQSFFETYKEYRDSVFYDASAWSVANFYGIRYKAEKVFPVTGSEVTIQNIAVKNIVPPKSDYGYIIDWKNAESAPLLYALQVSGLKLAAAFKPFSINDKDGSAIEVHYGSLLLPVSKQSCNPDEVHAKLTDALKSFDVPVYALGGGYSEQGVDPGSRHVQALETPKVCMLIGEGTSSTEAGEVWHHLDQRLRMPVTKLFLNRFKGASLQKYNTLIMPSGSYATLDSNDVRKLSAWVSQGNTIIAIGTANQWLIKSKLVKEKLVEAPKKDKTAVARLPFVSADEHLGRESLGGALFKVTADITHPVAFGYTVSEIPVYKNNTVWLQPSESPYGTVSAYTQNPHIDGYISPLNLNHYMKSSASSLVSPAGQGRVIMFADNPVFRGTMYSTDRMLNNAIFLGKWIKIPARMTWNASEINEE